ncbi:MAG TPA: alpha/beta hydrolase [Jatrophihabitans sp.]|jgi:pimeloyl-ACP methyl ester carboxylesterase|uniref:alpha/beta fold hydrolase n=1 Tax=Jatrophihabitans sp. TaxID=1932789 RepID=UPI002DFCA0DF|nr:alpha/beta hydrolase [Jatrophihabitans sp.]
MRKGLIGGAVGLVAAGAGAALVADHRVAQQRRRAAGSDAVFAPATPTRSGFVGADDGLPLFYEQHGPDDAPVTVVFAHGFCLDHDIFVLQQRALAAAFGPQARSIAYDHRSHGRSGRSDAEHATIDQLGADLRAVVDALAPTGPLVLVGHSMGGMTVMTLAGTHPELFGPEGRVKGVLLASTSPGKLAAVTLGMPALMAKLKGPVLPLLLGGARRSTRVVERSRARLTDVAWVFVKRLSFGPDVDPAVVELVTTTIGRTGVDVIADFFPALMAHDKLAALEHLADTPVVIVAGADDVITPVEHSKEIAAAVPHARLVIVPATGHMALLEQPGAVDGPLAELIEDALATVRPVRRRRGKVVR